MKRILLISLGLFAMGCAASHQHTASCQQAPVLSAAAFQQHPAAALAFTPPITMGTPVLNLSRDGREPEAFWGYSQGATDYYNVVTDDYQNIDPWTGTYREAVSVRVGSTSR